MLPLVVPQSLFITQSSAAPGGQRQRAHTRHTPRKMWKRITSLCPVSLLTRKPNNFCGHTPLYCVVLF